MLLSEQIIHDNLVLHNAGMNTAQNAVGGHHSCSKAFSGLGLRLEDGKIKSKKTQIWTLIIYKKCP